MLICEGELPCQEVAIDGRKLLAVDVDGVVALPQVPALVDFANHIARSILDVHVAVDEIEGAPHPEDDLRPCTPALVITSWDMYFVDLAFQPSLSTQARPYQICT